MWVGYQGSVYKARFFTRGILCQCKVYCCKWPTGVADLLSVQSVLP